MKAGDCVRNINAGLKLRDMIKDGRVALTCNRMVGSKFTLRLSDAVYVNFNGKYPDVTMLPGVYDLDMNQQATKCGCMSKMLKGNVRDQNNWW